MTLLIAIIIGIVIFRRVSNSSPRERKERVKEVNTQLGKLKAKTAYRAFEVRGLSFDGREKMISTIVRRHGWEGIDNIKLVPEPDNTHDHNAIKIIFKDVGHIGYVPKERAVKIGNILDKHEYIFRWEIESHMYESYTDGDDEIDGYDQMYIKMYINRD